MNGKLRVFFEFRLPLISYVILFFSILLLYIFNFRISPITTHIAQFGILILFAGFGIRILASITVKYLGKIKITGIYAICRHPMLLGQFISFVGLNLMVCNILFTFISIVVFVCNDVLSCIKYDKILAHYYRDVWKIYSKNTKFVLPFTNRIKDVLTPSISSYELDNSHNTPIFFAMYAIMVELSTLSNL